MITKQQALTLTHGQVIKSVIHKNADKTPMRARVNGKIKTWVTRPLEFRVPMVHGLRTYFYLSQYNAMDWEI